MWTLWASWDRTEAIFFQTDWMCQALPGIKAFAYPVPLPPTVLPSFFPGLVPLIPQTLALLSRKPSLIPDCAATSSGLPIPSLPTLGHYYLIYRSFLLFPHPNNGS